MQSASMTKASSLPHWIPKVVRISTENGLWSASGPIVTISQRQISDFAYMTEDFQDIHLSSETARLAGFPSTIAHGFFILGLLPHLSCIYSSLCEANLSIIPFKLGNTLIKRPVHAGSNIRAKTKVTACYPDRRGAYDFEICFSIERLHGDAWKQAVYGALSLKVAQIPKSTD